MNTKTTCFVVACEKGGIQKWLKHKLSTIQLCSYFEKQLCTYKQIPWFCSKKQRNVQWIRRQLVSLLPVKKADFKNGWNMSYQQFDCVHNLRKNWALTSKFRCFIQKQRNVRCIRRQMVSLFLRQTSSLPFLSIKTKANLVVAKWVSPWKNQQMISGFIFSLAIFDQDKDKWFCH